MDATCSPTHIRYPPDVSLLNEARENLEYMIYHMCKYYGLKLTRRYPSAGPERLSGICQEQIRAAIKKHFFNVWRDIGYLSRNLVPDTRDIPLLVAIYKVYEQQEYMYQNRMHSVAERIVRKKVKVPVEFEAKLEVFFAFFSFISETIYLVEEIFLP